MEYNRQLSEKEIERKKIRERYKGISTDLAEVIQAKAIPDFYDEAPKRVAVYVRVSTDNLQQTSSYELQKNYYIDIVTRHENWTLVEVYADEGISGTSLNHRDAFNRMIKDCKDGKIDLVVTKSVSRFARNIVDCITVVNELKALKPPVAIFFETEHIYTLNDNTEMSLSFVATMAQEESHIKSSIMNSSVEMRFSHGIVLTPVLLGYDHDENKELIVNYEEAQLVRLIFFMYLYGYTCQEIADTLTKLGCKTKKGNHVWASGSILQILRNERYCGDVLARKTYTPSYLNHRSQKNRGDRNQYRWKNHHEPIISKEDFIAVQHLIDNAKYGNKGILPELQVIKEGALKGFVSVNPRWSGFKAKDYIAATENIMADDIDFLDETTFNETQIKAQDGDFDLRGFEIARSQFFDVTDKVCVTFSVKDIFFSIACIKKLNYAQYIEMLINPVKQLLVIRVCDRMLRNSMKWAKMNSEGKIVSRTINGRAFLKNLYELFGWDTNYKYRIRGVRKIKDNIPFFVFDIRETELFVSRDNIASITDVPFLDDTVQPIIPNTKKSVLIFPTELAEGFGNEYYNHTKAKELSDMEREDGSGISQQTVPFEDNCNSKVTSQDIVKSEIENIINTIKQEEDTDGNKEILAE